MATDDTIRDLVEPIIESLDAAIYDVEYAGGVVRITLDRPGGIDLDTIAEATRQISREFDLVDPIPSRYTLEVSSPGLERALRTEAHWVRAVGESVQIKLKAHVEGERRFDAQVVAVDGTTVTLLTGAGESVVVDLDDVERAKTRLEWGPAPKPGSPDAARAMAARNDRSASPVPSRVGPPVASTATSSTATSSTVHPRPHTLNSGDSEAS